MYTTHTFVNATIIICPSPKWGYGSTNALFTVGSNASSASVPKFYTYNETVIALLASINKVIPSTGLSTAAKVTISGNSFSFSKNISDAYDSGPYVCHFFAADPAGVGLKERYGQVDAVFMSSSQLICNISTWSSRFSAANVSVAVSCGNSSATLLEPINSTHKTLVVSSGTSAIRSRAGMYIKIDKEIMLVIEVFVQTDTSVTCAVRRAQQGSGFWSHAAGDYVLSFLPLSVGVLELHHMLKPSFNSISTVQALITGGSLIRLSGRGFEASVLDTPNTLPGINYNVMQLTSSSAAFPKPSDLTDTYWAASFQIFGNRSSNVSEIEIVFDSEGSHSIWIYTVKCNTSSFELCEQPTLPARLENSWERIDLITNQIQVPASLRHMAKLVSGVPVLQGQTRTFLVISTSGFKHARDQDMHDACPQTSSAFCEAASDAFIALMPGDVMLVEKDLQSNVPETVISYLGHSLYVGRIGYVTHPHKVEYKCVFESGSNFRVESSPTRAFAIGLDQVDAAHDIVCLSPPWPSDQLAVRISLECTSGINPVADTDLAHHFQMLGYWTDVYFPGGALYASGGKRLEISWFLFDNVAMPLANQSVGEYACEFQGENSHVQTTQVFILNGSFAWCLTPTWMSEQTSVRLNLLRKADKTLVPWRPNSTLLYFDLHGLYADRCFGHECISCLGWSCLEHPLQHNTSGTSLEEPSILLRSGRVASVPQEAQLSVDRP